MIDRWPRVRPPLPPEQARIYEDEYRRNRTGGGLAEGAAQRLERWMHRRLATGSGRVLELGAGTLNHVPYEHEPDVYDVVEPFRALWTSSPHRTRVRHFFDDTAEATGPYDRIVSIAVLEHLVDLPLEVARCALLLAPDGRFQAGIPTEGGFLWGLGWRLTTGISYRLRTRHPYRNVMRHEHVNSEAEIRQLVAWMFEEVRVDRFPTPIRHLSFYTTLEATGPRLDRARAVVEARRP